MLQDFSNNLSTKTGYNFKSKNGTVEHLTVINSESAIPYLDQLPRLQSVSYEFNRHVNKEKLNHFEELDTLFRKVQIKYLKLQNSKQLESLPETIKNQPLVRLAIIACPKLKDISSIIGELKQLEELELTGLSFDLGDQFPNLPKLKILKLNLKSLTSLKGLESCSQLKSLEIVRLNVALLPRQSFNLPNLNKLVLSNMENLEQLPSLVLTPNLEEIFIQNCISLKDLNFKDYALPKLKEICLINLGNQSESIEFPLGLTSSEQLEVIKLFNIPFIKLPAELNRLIQVKKIVLSNLQITYLPDVFEGMRCLEELTISECKNLVSLSKSIANLSKLKTIKLNRLPILEKVDFEFSNLKELKKIDFFNLPKLHSIHTSLEENESVEEIIFNRLPELTELPHFSGKNKNLIKIDLKNIPKVTVLSDKLEMLTRLEELNIASTNIKKLPSNFHKLSNLKRFYFYGASLEYLPMAIANMPKLSDFYFQDQVGSIMGNPKLLNPNNVFDKIRKFEDGKLKEAVFYWIGNSHEHIAMTKELKIKTLQVLSLRINGLPFLVLSNIHLFNPSQKAITADTVNKAKIIWINGRIHGGKNTFKEKLRNLDLKVVTRFSSKVDIVVIGERPEVPNDLFEYNVTLSTQVQLEEISKKINPALFQRTDFKEEYIQNLKNLLWSNNPENEKIAFEMIRTNGLPDSLEAEVVLVAKTSSDKNLRVRMRNFLKGKLSELKQKGLITVSPPFRIHQLNGYFSENDILKMHYAQYKRTNKPETILLNIGKKRAKWRQEVFEELLPELTKSKRTLKPYCMLFEDEWNLLLNQDIFLGNLEQITLYLSRCFSIPVGLLKHKDTIKMANLSLPSNFQIGDIYSLHKLNELYLNLKGGQNLPEGISQLKRLKKLYIYADKPVSLPLDIIELKKLKHLHVSPSIKNKQDLTGKLACL